MILGNPVRGTIHPLNWHRPNGNADFKVTRRFGCSTYGGDLPYKDCAHFHRGMDIGNRDCGAAVLAVAAGRVTLAGKDPLSGNALRVVLSHADGSFTLYYHLADELVSVGQHVAKGEVIGRVGRTGWTDGSCHLHFEVHRNGNRLSFTDPWPLLEQNEPKPRTVTLKPRDGTRIREGSSTAHAVFAETRLSDNTVRTPKGKSLGAITTPRLTDGTVDGGKWELPDGTKGDRWHRIKFSGRYRFVASGLAVVS